MFESRTEGVVEARGWTYRVFVLGFGRVRGFVVERRRLGADREPVAEAGRGDDFVLLGRTVFFRGERGEDTGMVRLARGEGEARRGMVESGTGPWGLGVALVDAVGVGVTTGWTTSLAGLGKTAGGVNGLSS